MDICHSKIRYDAEFAATVAAAQSEYRYDHPMKTYRCGNHWHVASARKVDRRKFRSQFWVCARCQMKVKHSNRRKHMAKHQHHQASFN